MIRGQAEQYQFRTASGTVVSPAKTGAASTPSVRVIATRIIIMKRLPSRFEDRGSKEAEGQRPRNEKRRSGIAAQLLGVEG